MPFPAILIATESLDLAQLPVQLLLFEADCESEKSLRLPLMVDPAHIWLWSLLAQQELRCVVSKLYIFKASIFALDT